MAFKLAEAYVDMSVHRGGLDAGMASVRSDLNRMTGAGASLPLGLMLGGLGAGLAVIGGISAGLGKAMMAASDLNEQMSKSGVVFGDANGIVVRGADEMAAAFNVPKTTFIDAASSIGLIAKASGLAQPAAAQLGSDFARLGVDASSFYNVPLEEALIAIRAGLVGESEPMRRFGVLLSEGAVKAEAVRLKLAKMSDTLTEGQKVQARASLITKGLGDAHGDMERTAEGAANKIRSIWGGVTNVLADVGVMIKPLTDGMLEVGRETVTGVQEWTTWAKAAEGSIGAVGSAAGDPKLANLGGLLNPPLDAAATKAERLAAATKAAAASLKLMGDMRDKFTTTGMSDVQKAMFETKAKGGTARDVREARDLTVGIGMREASADALDLGLKLRSEAGAFGMSARQAQLYQMQLRGARPEVLRMAAAHARNLDAMEQAKAKADELAAAGRSTFEATRTPTEKLDREVRGLREQRAAGVIDDETFRRAGTAAAKQAAEGNIALAEAARGPRTAASIVDAEGLSKAIQMGALSGQEDTAAKHLKVAEDTKTLLEQSLKRNPTKSGATFQ